MGENRIKLSESALRWLVGRIIRESGTEELRKAVDEMEEAQESEASARERVKEKLESLPTAGKK
jgi:hypothetical protein